MLLFPVVPISMHVIFRFKLLAGFIETEMTQRLDKEVIAEATSLKRLGSCEDVADAG